MDTGSASRRWNASAAVAPMAHHRVACLTMHAGDGTQTVLPALSASWVVVEAPSLDLPPAREGTRSHDGFVNAASGAGSLRTCDLCIEANLEVRAKTYRNLSERYRSVVFIAWKLVAFGARFFTYIFTSLG